ncbi:UGT80A2, partial [Symbiodinium sp. KB8]
MGRPLVLMAPSSATFCKQELLEESIFWCQHAVPHGWLLPRCAVAIHHGGIGTVLAALRAQVPQLVLPLAYDQPFWASCVKDLNVGDSADLDHLSVVVLARKLQRLLRDEVRATVRRVAEEVEMQGKATLPPRSLQFEVKSGTGTRIGKVSHPGPGPIATARRVKEVPAAEASIAATAAKMKKKSKLRKGPFFDNGSCSCEKRGGQLCGKGLSPKGGGVLSGAKGKGKKRGGKDSGKQSGKASQAPTDEADFDRIMKEWRLRTNQKPETVPAQAHEKPEWHDKNEVFLVQGGEEILGQAKLGLWELRGATIRIGAVEDFRRGAIWSIRAKRVDDFVPIQLMAEEGEVGAKIIEVAEGSEEVPKRARAFCLPEGAEVIANKGKGNCLFEACELLYVSGFMQSKDQIESHWDGLGPDDKQSVQGQERLFAVALVDLPAPPSPPGLVVEEEVGAWAVAFEQQAGTETAVTEIMAMAATAPLRSAQSGACLRPARPIHVFLEEDPDAALDVLGRSAGEVQFIYREILRERCYGELNKLPADSIVVDGGLNLGLFSLILARQWKGPGTLTVLAFEPAKETFELALANLRRNGVCVINHGQSLPSNSSRSTSGATAGTAVVHCFQLALSDRDGRDQLCYFPYLTSSSTLARHRPAKDEAKSNGCFDRRLVDIFFADEKQ